ncbi:MAG: cardiolipin synthase [Eubacteriales bacterium]|nr:cardiolipin synthase [Eubacteriales bacterium]
MRKRWFYQVCQQRFYVIVLMLVQLYILAGLIASTSRWSSEVLGLMNLVSVMAALRIISMQEKTNYKLLWVFLFFLIPVFGGLMYLLVLWQSSGKKVNLRLSELKEKSRGLLAGQKNLLSEDCVQEAGYLPLMRYLQNVGYPLYEHLESCYYPSGEQWFERLCQELKQAKRYIFLEYFIIQEGTMWNTILDILKCKAAEGVEVWVLYDDIGSLITLPKRYGDTLRSCGIRCRVFNPFRPVFSTLQNNRDHRKITVIDGKTAFTGGINLADEYINLVDKYGHWKDSGILIKGPAVWQMVLLFLEMWNLAGEREEHPERFRPEQAGGTQIHGDGFVQPYGDCPVDGEHVGEHVYLHVITHAKSYVYINTPYLIVDDGMLSALSLAVKSGIDVRIITPHHWDKRIVHMTTRSYYRRLIAAGVRIYEYSSGFLHAKGIVSDDHVAVVGTTNLDYRSLYLHFECGVCLYENQTVLKVKEDFLDTLSRCQEIKEEDCKTGLIAEHFQEMLHLFAPLM